MKRDIPPLLLRNGRVDATSRLHRTHEQFDERFLQELLVEHPELLPVSALRPDAGTLLCIGREVATHDSGTIDNLYLTTAGYVVVVETKLWRNPQSRREVVSQVLDYVKDVVNRDFEWLESVWQEFARERGRKEESLIEAMRELDPELEDSSFVDRVQHAMRVGHVVALIVGDGIETRLQQLVAHLCRDSAHLRYGLGLVSLRFYRIPAGEDLIVVSELVQEVEPVERAYVRIEFANTIESQCESYRSPTRKRLHARRERRV